VETQSKSACRGISLISDRISDAIDSKKQAFEVLSNFGPLSGCTPWEMGICKHWKELCDSASNLSSSDWDETV
jgi:hypothetical protein